MGSPAERGRVLVTGVSGFTGRHVAAELVGAGYEVVGLARRGAGEVPGVVTHRADLLDRAALRAAVAEVRPDAVVHLAAVSFVAHGDADELYRTNVVGTRNLLDALCGTGARPRIVVLAGSANVYGNTTVEPVHEDVPPAPANDYAISKVAVEHLAGLWADRLPIAITRPFNYTGVGQHAKFLIPKVVDHFRRGARRIELGNTGVWRDFGDVRTVARYYRRLVEVAPAGATLNLCSGVAHSLAEVLKMMAAIAGYEIEVEVNPAFVRANEVVRLVGSRERLVATLGEEPVIPFEKTLEWMYSA
ncbi:NAD-dependent epimerase/dehydratase family protein [Saccharothrix syringae]|uniref:NAD-dependent epimerase/dehydratase family protein n=1 Tax=Saccharothrix syringae TaxID=103733 RepID=A0A5Q0GUS2_SACSY|nr:NAD-dependent epimerase/dehydratase family protein [Saccharothrix syringae]QFZ17856.1 NAD-dependent epimerase/dehydratase family protein [Saccharothrix syringae]